MDPAMEVVVMRDGAPIYRTIRAVHRVPEGGYTMATQAVTDVIQPNDNRRFYGAVQDKTRAARGATSSALAACWNKLISLGSALRNSRIVTSVTGVIATGWNFTRAQLSKLGRTGVIAGGIAVATSEQGQRVIGATLGFIWDTATTILRGACQAIGFLPFIGSPVSTFLESALNKVNNLITNLTMKAKDTTVVKSIHHTGFISRNLQRFAAPLAVLRMISAFVPAVYFLRAIAYVVFAGWLLRKVVGPVGPAMVRGVYSKYFDRWEATAPVVTTEEVSIDTTEEIVAETVVITETVVEQPTTQAKPTPQPFPEMRSAAKVPSPSTAKKLTVRNRVADEVADITLKVIDEEGEVAPGNGAGAIRAAFRQTDLSNPQTDKAVEAYVCSVLGAYSVEAQELPFYITTHEDTADQKFKLTELAHAAMNVGYDLSQFQSLIAA